MKHLLIAGALALGLVACGDTTREERLGTAERVSNAALAFAETQVQTYRSLGVDFVALTPRQQNLARAACGTLIGAVQAGRAFIDSAEEVEASADRLSADAMTWCLGIADVAGENLPE